MKKDSKMRLRLFGKRSLSAFGVVTMLAGGGLMLTAPTAAQAVTTLDAAQLEEVANPEQMLMSAPFDVTEYGYTELEFFASGEARAFLNADGTVMGTSGADYSTTAEVGGVAGDYKTRVVIRKPAADKFNGTLLVEWANVTTGQDGEFVFGEIYDRMLSDGYAVAVVSAQQIGVNALVNTLPERYGSLEVTSNCAVDLNCPRDAMGWDIFGQIAKALKESPDSPFADLDRDVESVLALGQSQSAVILSHYYNKIQPVHNFFDGIVFWDYAGQLRSDIDIPGVSLHSWTFQGSASESSEMTRRWEVAGAAHGSWYVNEYMEKMFLRDGTQPNGQGFYEWLMKQGDYANGGIPCVNPNLGTKVRVGHAIAGAIEAVDVWARGGEPAAPSTYFDRDSNGNIMHDEEGKAVGGLQLADVAVPTVKNQLNTGGWTCGAAGGWEDYTEQELEQKYVSHQGYVAQVTAVTETARAAGYITDADAALTIAEAQASNIAQTDIELAATVNVASGAPGDTVTLGVTPTVTRGAWLEANGTKVPVVASGSATFTPAAGQARAAAETLWSGTATLTGTGAVPNAAQFVLPASSTGGTVTVQWCIDADAQAAEYPGHVNATCGTDQVRTATIAVSATPAGSEEPAAPATPADPGAGSNAQTTGGTVTKNLATTGDSAQSMGGIAAIAALLLTGATAAFVARRRKNLSPEA